MITGYTLIMNKTGAGHIVFGTANQFNGQGEFGSELGY